MSALLIYKQRFLQPNYKSTPSKNAAHVEYIGTRPGVMKEPNAHSGLFGVADNQYKDVISIAEGRIRALEQSKAGRNVYRSIISFTEEQARALKLNTLSDWKAYVKDQITAIAAANNIKPTNVEWLAAVHQKDGHPHVHITFWDKQQQIQVPFVKKELVQKLRGAIIKNTYPQLYTEYSEAKDAAYKDLRKLARSEAMDYEAYLNNENIIQLLEERLPEGDIRSSSVISAAELVGKPYMPEILQKIYQLRIDLPQSGSLKYKIVSPEIKERIDDIIKIALKEERIRIVFDRFISSKLDLKEMYTENEGELMKAQEHYTKDAFAVFGNRLLQLMQRLHFDTVQTGAESPADGDCMVTAGSIVDMLYQMSRITKQNYAHIHALQAAVDSKNAKMEAAIKARDKGLGVEY